MKNKQWILIDTETTGFAKPIFVVEIAAQRMRGWNPEGPSFRKLLNQNEEIPAQASRVHGYTREILERDGEPALEVYSAFRDYVEELPIVAFNLQYDLDEVLIPEWQRIGIDPIGCRGFCALKLSQRLLDPVPAGNCKLQTLRQYYRLPERGAHTALGDVNTVIDLLDKVLKPIADYKGLETWDQILAFAEEEWFPSRIMFGKFKGRLVQEALTDNELMDWIEWIAGSTNSRNARVGRWYLNFLEALSDQDQTDNLIFEGSDSNAENSTNINSNAIVNYVNWELENLRRLVAYSRARLSELEVKYTKEKAVVDLLQARLFKALRPNYQRIDQLRLIIDYRKKYLDLLTQNGEEVAAEAETEYQQAKEQTDREYEETDASINAKAELPPDLEEKLTGLWRKLVKLYHPDKFSNQPEKMETYEKLIGVINNAKDNGDVNLLQEIADNPEEFIQNQGWEPVEFNESHEIIQLQRLHRLLQLDIFAMIEALNRLHQSSDYELVQLVEKKPDFFDELVTKRTEKLDLEIRELVVKADKLAQEIEELNGTPPEFIV
jgi:DNA polymerase III epsilon subunit-like protein